jgi:hypothetical protein
MSTDRLSGELLEWVDPFQVGKPGEVGVVGVYLALVLDGMGG